MYDFAPWWRCLHLNPATINRQRWNLDGGSRRRTMGWIPITLNCEAAPALGWAEQESGALGILEHIRHLPVLTSFLFWRWGLLRAFWGSGHQDPSGTPWLNPLGKGASWDEGTAPTWAFLCWVVPDPQMLHVICADKGPCGCWDVLQGTGLSVLWSPGKCKTRDDLFSWKLR